jgi:hypothetical protein
MYAIKIVFLDQGQQVSHLDIPLEALGISMAMQFLIGLYVLFVVPNA